MVNVPFLLLLTSFVFGSPILYFIGATMLLREYLLFAFDT